jgi:hypothetical protein
MSRSSETTAGDKIPADLLADFEAAARRPLVQDALLTTGGGGG